MEITEVRIFLKEGANSKLRAYATLTFDNAFVVRNVKVIEGNKGLFIAMPSRKAKRPCSRCNFKNEIRSRYCNDCGAKLGFRDTHEPDTKSSQSEHRDIAHPITVDCREYIEKRVLEAYERERASGYTKVQTNRDVNLNVDEAPDDLD